MQLCRANDSSRAAALEDGELPWVRSRDAQVLQVNQAATSMILKIFHVFFPELKKAFDGHKLDFLSEVKSLNLYDLTEWIIKPATTMASCSYVELVAGEAAGGGEAA